MSRFAKTESRLAARAAQACVLVLALLLVPVADAAINLGSLSPNWDQTKSTKYRNGDKPFDEGGGLTCPPDTWSETDIGDGGGEVCDDEGDWSFNVLGTTFRQNAHLVYKDAGAGDVQFEATVTDSYSGASGTNAGLGIGLRETALVDSYLFQVHVENTGANIVKCTFGANGTYTTINGASGLTRPVDLGVTYDVSTGDLKAFRDGLEVCSTNREMSDVLAYAVGQSKSTTMSLSATLAGPTLDSTIDLYTPTDPPVGTPPVLVSPIPNQTGTQGVAFSLDFRPFFTGATSHTVSGLSGGISETSDGVISGTPNATAVSNSPQSGVLCGVNADGTTCDPVLFTFSPAVGGGSLFTLPDVANVKSTFDCSVTGGANGSSWASIRTSGSNTRPMPGDIVEITSGERGAVEFRNCHGTSSSRIVVRKTASATRLTITGAGGGNDAFLLRDTTYLHVNGLVNWTGHGGGCGADATLSETPLSDCGILIDGDNQFLFKWRGQAFGHIVEGLELDGNWPGTVSNNGADVAFSPNDQVYCVSNAPSLLNREFRENMIVRRNYAHDIAHEIMYFGPNVNYGQCPANMGVPRLRNIEISRNFMQFGGWDGGNLKSAIDGQNIVEFNVILDIGGGTTASGANSVGFALFESQGILRYNKIRRTSDPPGGGAGLRCAANQAPSAWGTLECEIYGNDVSDTDGACISVGHGANADATRNAQVWNNTVTDCGAQGVTIANSVTAGGFVRGNISTNNINVSPGNIAQSNNRQCAEAQCGFVDHAANDYRLQSGSASVNTGGTCPSVDILGTVRPQGGSCDQGAYEFAP